MDDRRVGAGGLIPVQYIFQDIFPSDQLWTVCMDWLPACSQRVFILFLEAIFQFSLMQKESSSCAQRPVSDANQKTALGQDEDLVRSADDPN